MRKEKSKHRKLVYFYHQQKGVCPICSESMEKDFKKWLQWFDHSNRKKGEHRVRRKEAEINLDHIFPVSLGGRGLTKNLALTHTKCNSRKGNKITRLEDTTNLTT